MLTYETPHAKYVLSLQRWVRVHGCIARKETKFLERGDDLLTLSHAEDGAVTWLERIVCDTLVSMFKVRKSCFSLVSILWKTIEERHLK
jgi:hypothetical protein